MKKIAYYFTFISLIIFSTASSCKNPKDTGDELPTGENTLYCYVDGRLYIPKTGDSTPPVPAIYFSLCTDGVSFLLGADDLVLLFQNGITQIGSITLNQSNYDACWVHDNHAFLGQKELGSDGVFHNIYYYTHNGSGTVNITYLSADKKHFKGTFEMTVYHENTGVEKHITDGHFDINLNTLNQ